MNNYVFLLILLIILWIFNFKFNKKDIFHPVSIVIILEVIALIFSMIGLNSWNTVKDLDLSVVLFIVGSIVCLFIGTELSKIFVVSNKEYNVTLRLTIFMHYSLIIVSIIIFFVHYYFIKIAYGTGDIFEIMSLGHSVYFDTSILVNPFAYKISGYFMMMLKALAYGYIIISTYSFANRKKGAISALIPPLLFAATLLLRGSRHNVILTILAYLLLLYVFCVKNRKNVIKINILFAICSLILIAIILPIFVNLAPILGQNTYDDSTAYITYYFGATLPSVNQAIINPSVCSLTESNIVGIHLFRGLFESLNDFGFTNVDLPLEIGWIVFSGRYPSNIFSAPFVFYMDFGVIGLVFFSVLEGFLYGLIYRKVRYSKNPSLIICVIFIYVMPSSFNWYRTEDLLSSELSSISNYVCVLITYLMFKIRIGKYSER